MRFKEFYLSEAKIPGVEIRLEKDLEGNHLVLAFLKNKGNGYLVHVFSEKELDNLGLSREDISNDLIGYARIKKFSSQYIVDKVNVSRKFRRQGIATDLYNTFENKTGYKLTPSSMQTDDAIAFWKSRK